MSVSVEQLLIVQIANWLNSHKEDTRIDIDVLVNFSSKSGRQIWLQSAGGGSKNKEYVDGGYQGKLNLVVYSQMSKADIDGELAKIDIPLINIADFAERSGQFTLDGFDIISMEMTAAPTGAYQGQDGTFISRAVFEIVYDKI